MTSLNLPTNWIINESSGELLLFEICQQNHPDCEQVIVTRSLRIFESFRWRIYVHGQELDPQLSPALSHLPINLSYSALAELVTVLVQFNVCIGNPDKSFVKMAEDRKAQFLSIKKEVVARLHRRYIVISDGVPHSSTIRNVKCELLTEGVCCHSCTKYRNNLRAMYSNYLRQQRQTVTAAKANTRFMKTPQKLMKMKSLKRAVVNKQRQLSRLKAKLDEVTRHHGVIVNEQMQDDFSRIIEDNSEEMKKLPIHDFRRAFWEQQV